MGSNDKSLKALELFATYDLERNGVKKSRYFKLYLSIIIPALAILIPMVIDISSDAVLTANYASYLHNDTLKLKNHENLTQFEQFELGISPEQRSYMLNRLHKGHFTHIGTQI